MRKISYPKGTALEIFESNYLEALSGINKEKIDEYLQKIPMYKGSHLTFDRLALLPLGELILIQKTLSGLAEKEWKTRFELDNFLPSMPLVNEFLDLFDYKTNQSKISALIRNEKAIDLKTCHYCGIDYINGFSDFGDYAGPVDFLKRADTEDLLAFPEIGPKTQKRIEAYRRVNTIKKIDDIKLQAHQRTLLEEFDFKKNYDHFTLDHIMPQKPYGFFALCLYNLVPSCYCCNTKFKGSSKDFTIDKNLLKISPTSKDFSIPDNFKFKVLYSGKLKDITKINDFVLRIESSANLREVSKYVKTFKLTGRYVAHKDELLDLIIKKVKNPDCEIANRARLLKISAKEYKEIIYGKDLFQKESSTPMHKFKRDIAEKIKII